MDLHSLIACPECDQLHRVFFLPPWTSACCSRCGSTLFRVKRQTIDRTLALCLTGLILFVLASAGPILDFNFRGQIQVASLWKTVAAFLNSGWPLVGFIVLLTVWILPLFFLLGMVYLLLPLKLGRRPWMGAPLFRLIRTVEAWCMLEVLLLGILVGYFKLLKTAGATIETTFTFWMLAALVFVFTAALNTLDAHFIWERLEGHPLPTPEGHLPPRSTERVKLQHCLLSCPSCHHLLPASSQSLPCPRCGAIVFQRQPHSLSRTWALVLAAMILYLPANLLPVMQVVSYGKVTSDTIMSGVLYFLRTGAWPLALLIFFASIVVPLVKLGTLIFLLLSVHRKSPWKPRDRTRLFNLTEIIGRWSMVDIFMVAIMVAVVDVGSMATVKAGPGATAFAAVVILTMLAARCFEPRLIWDAMESHERKS